MDRRPELHEILCEIVNITDPIDGDRHVYFQPPTSLKMKYRCIRYSGDGYDTKRADNKSYINTKRYKGVVIDPDPDSDIPEKMLDRFEMCSFDREYISDNLNHFPFTLYY